jgi:hypothetical protein
MSALRSKRSFLLLLALCVVTGTLWAAQDPFVGKWKLDPAKSKQTDVMKVESLGGNKYAINFGGGVENIVADGTDQPGNFGTMLAVTIEGLDTWKVVRKNNGRMMLSAMWKLSQDGTSLTDNYTEYPPNTAPSTVVYHYTRTADGQGFAGTWESTMPVDSASMLQIQLYEGNGLSFIRSSQQTPRNIKFDEKDYPIGDRVIIEGVTSSALRKDERTLEITDKIQGKIIRTEQIELSPDLKTFTWTMRRIGQGEPDIFVYERQ